MISPYQFFKIYSAVQLHFTSRYDIFKYAGKSKTINIDAFDIRRDKTKFIFWSNKIESQDEALKLCVFNFLYDPHWLYNSVENAKTILLVRNKYYSTFTKNIKHDYDVINQLKLSKQLSFEQLTHPTKCGNEPPILQLALQDIISIEFICVAARSPKFLSTWKSVLDPLVIDYGVMIENYIPFVSKFAELK